jgi:hypothetical protein
MKCTHHECRCARAAELAAMGLTVQAIEVHSQEVTCRQRLVPGELYTYEEAIEDAKGYAGPVEEPPPCHYCGAFVLLGICCEGRGRDAAFARQHGGQTREQVEARKAAKRERRIARRKARREALASPGKEDGR